MSQSLRVTFVMTHPSMHRLWQHAQNRLAEQGITLTVVSQMAQIDWPSFIDETIACADALYLDMSRHGAMFEDIVAAARSVPCVIAAGIDVQVAELGGDATLLKAAQTYLKAASGDNLVNLVLSMLYAAGKLDQAPPAPTDPQLIGVFHPDVDTIWSDAPAYLSWAAERFPHLSHAAVVPVLQDRTGFLNGDSAMMDQAVQSLVQQNILPMPIFVDWQMDGVMGVKGHALEVLLRGVGDRIGAVWNGAIVHGSQETPVPDGGPFGDFNVPVMQLIRNWRDTREEWQESSQGLDGMALTFGFTRPEIMGCSDPTVTACTRTEANDLIGETRIIEVVPEQLDRLARRTARWITLRHKPNAEKQVVVFLHNPPCKGLEATIGNAAGLHALESTVDLLRRLHSEGYTVGNIPEDGKALLQLILDKKAISEFRWTNVGEILSKGGALTCIDEATYRQDFDQLPQSVQTAVDEAWGAFPAKSMVKDADTDHPELVVTGLQFGNIRVMTDPKRGCWGPKCDGEVCRILHEPDIPPPHHWLATYWYVQRTADAVIHMGAESPLEYLPGKRAGLSETCYSYLSIGDLPSLYPYIMNSTGEALVSKRRGRAVLIDHLSAPLADSGDISEQWDQLQDLHRQYTQSNSTQDAARREQLKTTLAQELTALGLCPDDADDAALDLAIDQLPRRLEVLKTRKVELNKHVLGQVPGEDMRVHYRKELRGVNNRVYDEAAFEAGLDQTYKEMDGILDALNGGFIPPGLSGHLSMGKADVVPTGRNVFGIDLKTVPTAAAYEIGARMGEKLLNSYLNEEKGVFPQTIGITMWSSDAFQADGELAGQILWLLGVRVEHDNGGRVKAVHAVPSEDLTMTTDAGDIIPRPRIDVVVHMSSVVRDTLAQVYGWLDKAIMMVADLDEPADVNFLRAHVQTRLSELAEAMPGKADSALKRLAASRVFSTKDGAYGDGLALALDASAWEDDKDLAEIVVNWNSAAFSGTGKQLADSGSDAARVLMGEYASLIKNMDISYQKMAPGADILKYGCYLGTQAGNSAAKRGLGGGSMRLFWGDSQSTKSGEIRSVKEEITLSLAQSVLNQDWLDSQKGDDYTGATGVSNRVNHLFQWSATTHEVSQAQFDAVHDILVGNEDNRDWLQQTNIYAFEEISRRLLEADARGLWTASEKRKAELHAAVLQMEGDIEDRMGEVSGEFQGSSVDIKTRESVKEWSYDFRIK